MISFNGISPLSKGGAWVQVALNPPPVPTKPETQANVDALTSAISHLVEKMDSRPNSPFDWSTPTTHFVDSLPGYDALTLGMVLATVILLAGSIIVAWSLYKRNTHASEMLKSMAVPLEAFTAVVQQSAASTEILGRRIEELSDSLSISLRHVSESMAQMADAVNRQRVDVPQKANQTHLTPQRIARPPS